MVISKTHGLLLGLALLLTTVGVLVIVDIGGEQPLSETAEKCQEFAADHGTSFDGTKVVSIESSHPYCSNMEVIQTYNFTDSNITYLELEFDSQTTLDINDNLVISLLDNGARKSYSYHMYPVTTLSIPTSSFNVSFTSQTEGEWGYKFTVTPKTSSFEMSECQREYEDHDHGSIYDDLAFHKYKSRSYCKNMHVSQRFGYSNPLITHLQLQWETISFLNSGDRIDISYDTPSGTAGLVYASGYDFAHTTIPSNAFNLTFVSGSFKHEYAFDLVPRRGSFQYFDCEHFASYPGATFDGLETRVIESAHPYCSDMSVKQSYSFTNTTIKQIQMVFDSLSKMGDLFDQNYYDTLSITSGDNTLTFNDYDGPQLAHYTFDGRDFDITFESGQLNSWWGYLIYLIPIPEGTEVLTCAHWEGQEGATFNDTLPQVISSPHRYCDGMSVTQDYSFSDDKVTQIDVNFSEWTYTFDSDDYLKISYETSGRNVTSTFWGNYFSDFTIESRQFTLEFISDGVGPEYGFDMTVTPVITETVSMGQNNWPIEEDIEKEMSLLEDVYYVLN
mmetsp:Transcript_56389/g.64379  ORF Transcript_56389/g.64379 Transcript_56389/m.64379 type:complete len:559 (+) Transcript_56389:44-1720(+)